MMLCEKCPRLQLCGNKVYCPFFQLQPCIHGFHTLPNYPDDKLIRKPSYIPEFKPMKNNKYDWKKYHDAIFTLIFYGDKVKTIANKLDINVWALRDYIERYKKE